MALGLPLSLEGNECLLAPGQEAGRKCHLLTDALPTQLDIKNGAPYHGELQI
jgi:hypothetical protein